MPAVIALAQVLMLSLALSLVGCDGAPSPGQKSASSGPHEEKEWSEVAREYLRENEVEYRIKRDGCELWVSIGRLDDGQETAGVGLVLCPTLPYSEKLKGVLLLLERAREEGRLTRLRRVGPGPGRDICEGEVRTRLLETTLERLSDSEFVRRNPRLVMGRGNRLDAKYLFEEAGAFREYREVFRRMGYQLELEDHEKVVFERVGRKDWPRDYRTPIGEVLVPCNAMVYFRARPVPGRGE